MNDGEYDEDEYLQLSGLQHFLFCRRQWALIHIEQQWNENVLTTDGMIFHERVHDENETEKRKNILIERGMRVSSKKLGISGICDVVEFHQSETGISLPRYQGMWEVIPIEYKRGKSDIRGADAAQLCAEAMCLEEMLCCHIPSGYLFWGTTHRREAVLFDDALRKKTEEALTEMHQYYKRGYTPRTKQKKGCAHCSMKDICLPEISKIHSVRAYIDENIRNQR